jgi:hypothetical protein
MLELCLLVIEAEDKFRSDSLDGAGQDMEALVVAISDSKATYETILYRAL